MSLEEMDDGQTQEFTKSLVPLVNQDSKSVLELLATRVDEKEVYSCHQRPRRLHRKKASVS